MSSKCVENFQLELGLAYIKPFCTGLSWNQEGNKLAVSHSDNTLTICSLDNTNSFLVSEFNFRKLGCEQVKWIDIGNADKAYLLLLSAFDKDVVSHLMLYECQTNKFLFETKLESKAIRGNALSVEENKYIVTLLSGVCILGTFEYKLYSTNNTAERKLIHTIIARYTYTLKQNIVNDMRYHRAFLPVGCLSKDGNVVFIASEMNMVNIYQIANNKLLLVKRINIDLVTFDYIRTIIINQTNSALVISTAKGYIKIISLENIDNIVTINHIHQLLSNCSKKMIFNNSSICSYKFHLMNYGNISIDATNKYISCGLKYENRNTIVAIDLEKNNYFFIGYFEDVPYFNEFNPQYKNCAAAALSAAIYSYN